MKIFAVIWGHEEDLNTVIIEDKKTIFGNLSKAMAKATIKIPISDIILDQDIYRESR